MSNLRLLTYNTQCRSWAMDAFDQESFTPETTAEDRARRISERILGSFRPWDIICLNEVFDEDARGVFIEALGDEYPSYVIKCDYNSATGRPVSTVTVSGNDSRSSSLHVPGDLFLTPEPLVVWGELVAGKPVVDTTYEDSGLMLFSRFPFKQAAPPLGAFGGVLATVERVGARTYRDFTGNDNMAAKAVVYASIAVPGGEVVHVFATHMQADSGDEPTDATIRIRRAQAQQVVELIEEVASPGEEVIVLGDLNIDGVQFALPGPEDDPPPRREWRATIAADDSPIRGVLVDSWVDEQCPGDGEAGMGGRALPEPCDNGVSFNELRFDYVLRRPRSLGSRRIVQHMAVPFEVSLGPDTASRRSRTSDHSPLSIDLHRPAGHNSAVRAEELKFKTHVAPPDLEVGGSLEDGLMHWYRVDRPGAYGVKLIEGDGVELDVFGANNLSVAMRPFDGPNEPPPNDLPFGPKFAIAEPSWFIRVYLKRGSDFSTFRIRVHCFAGTSRADAIPLLRNHPTVASHREGQVHSTDFDGEDVVWMHARLHTRDDGSLLAASTLALESAETSLSGLLLTSRTRDTGDLTEVVAIPANTVGTHSYSEPCEGLFAVRRDPSANLKSMEFTTTLHSDLTYIYTAPVAKSSISPDPPNERSSRGTCRCTLRCLEDTSGFFGSLGTDEIEIYAHDLEGRQLLYVPNESDLCLDGGNEADVPGFDGVFYRDGLIVTLVELDDLSPNDRATANVPTFDEWKAFGPQSDLIHVPINFPGFIPPMVDGRYVLSLQLSPEPP